MVTLNEACERTLELFQKRPNANDWADNIIEGSEGLADDDYENYVRFLACPSRLRKNHPEVECKECDVAKAVQEYESAELPSYMKTEITLNGTEAIIHVRNTSVDDEKEQKSE